MCVHTTDYPGVHTFVHMWSHVCTSWQSSTNTRTVRTVVLYTCVVHVILAPVPSHTMDRVVLSEWLPADSCHGVLHMLCTNPRRCFLLFVDPPILPHKLKFATFFFFFVWVFPRPLVLPLPPCQILLPLHLLRQTFVFFLLFVRPTFSFPNACTFVKRFDTRSHSTEWTCNIDFV